MQCVILAAGRGTRMGELTEDCPKPMLPINGKPKLAYTLETLPEAINEVIFVIGYRGEQIREFFGEKYDGKKISYVEQKELNGTGGAVMLVKDKIIGEKFMVLMGDDLYHKDDLKKLLAHDFALLVYETDEAENYGLVDCDDQEYLQSVVESPHGRTHGLVSTNAFMLGVQFFNHEMTPKAPGSDEYGLPQTLVAIRKEHPAKIIRTQQWFPIGTPENLEQAQKVIKDFT